jgi:hypothetical protein
VFHRIVYLSTANGAPEQEELEALMERARQNNQRDGITGLVAYHDFTFIQVIEGPKEAVQACFERIKQSNLHRNIVVADDAEIDTRMFDQYAMAFVPEPDHHAPIGAAFTDLRDILDGDLGERLGKDQVVRNFLMAFLNSLRGL